MSWERLQPIPSGKDCANCHAKYRQGRSPYCATCTRLLMSDYLAKLEADDAREKERLQIVERADAERALAGRRTVTADGQEFEVIWDGGSLEGVHV